MRRLIQIASRAGMRTLPLYFCVVLSLGFMVSACERDSYDKGEGKYSLMRADFVEAYANASKAVTYVVTDDGDRLALQEPYTAKWIATADSVYRCVFYYNKVETEGAAPAVETVSMSRVNTLLISPFIEDTDSARTDPVRFESAWMSKSGKYLNLGLYVLTGTADDEDAFLKIGVMGDTLHTRTAYLTFLHTRHNVPEYFSTRVYASIPVDTLDADTVAIAVNTYDGVVTRRFVLR